MFKEHGLGGVGVLLGGLAMLFHFRKSDQCCTRFTNGDIAFAHIEEQLKLIPDIEKRQRKMEIALIKIATKMKIEVKEE